MRIQFSDNLLIDQSSGSPPFDMQPHLGLLSLIAMAESGGHEGRLYNPKLELARGTLALDESLYASIAAGLLRESPDVVGLTSLGCNFICTLKVASYIKQARPEVPIILGGPHATILDRQILEHFPQFDVIVRNEAELVLLPLLDALQRDRLDTVPGVTFRGVKGVITNPAAPLIEDVDGLPWPAYAHHPIHELPLTWLRVEAGRGCPFSCTFCSTASFFGRRYRLKSAGRLVSELDFLHQTYGISHFALMHDLFTVNRMKVQEFCEAVEARGYTWSCSARMDCVDAELLRHMQRAGCRSIYYGVETGSPRMQELSRKRQDLSLFEPILDATHGVEMEATVSFITGYPQEEQADQDETLDLIGSCFQRDPALIKVQLHLLTPEPGTRLFQEFGNRLGYDGYITDFNFPTLEPDDAVVMERYPDVFMNHHFFRGALPRERYVFAAAAFEALYPLGFPLLSHLLQFYQGRLSCLIAAMFNWSMREGNLPPLSGSAVRSFVESAHGPNHYLSSLVRYMTAADELSERRGRLDAARALYSAPNARGGHTSAYVLSPRARLLRDLHDCPQLLRKLTNRCLGADTLEESLRETRRDYLVFVESVHTGRVRNFELDPATAELIEFISIPRAPRECSAWLRREYRLPLRATFKELQRLGVVCRLQAKAAPSSPRVPYAAVTR